MDRSDMMHVMYDKKGPAVAKNFEKRGFAAWYCPTVEEALKLALELIPEGSSIAMGGCTSAHEIGLIKALEDGNYNYINRANL